MERIAKDYSLVHTSGMATTKVKPDKFTMTVGVETNGTSAKEATPKNAALVSKIIQALKDLGIADQQISTSYYSPSPIYGSNNDTANKVCIEIFPLKPLTASA